MVDHVKSHICIRIIYTVAKVKFEVGPVDLNHALSALKEVIRHSPILTECLWIMPDIS